MIFRTQEIGHQSKYYRINTEKAESLTHHPSILDKAVIQNKSKTRPRPIRDARLKPTMAETGVMHQTIIVRLYVMMARKEMVRKSCIKAQK